nr:TonB family protein [Myxococcota bacterium]
VLDSVRAMLLHESNLMVVLYLPREDVLATLTPSDHTTHCPFKGDASYWSLRVGDELREGATAKAAAGSELHLRIASATGVALRGDSEARLVRMRAGDVGIALERGRIVSTVGQSFGGQSLGGESRFVVMASEHRFEGHATRYEIELDTPPAAGTASVVRLWVGEGVVRVHRPDGRTDVVRAPGSWSSDGAAAELGGEVGRAHGIGDDTAAWPVLRVSHPDVVRWEVGDVAVGGPGELGMRVGAGQLAITGFDASGRAFRTVADVGGDGLTIDASGLVPEAPRVRADGYLPSQDIEEVMRRGLPRLRQCYELGLRARPDLEGTVVLRILVALDGSVSRARVVGGDVPDELQQCVRNYAERWTFPPPRGGTVTFDVPLSFGGPGAR